MITTTLPVGDTGVLRIDDSTGDVKNGVEVRTIDLWIRSTSVVSIPQLQWAYSLDGVYSSLKVFNFKNTTLWQKLGTVYAGYAETATLAIGNTHTTQVGGPAILSVDLQGGVNKVLVKVGTAWKTAIPYVRDGGVWKTVEVYVADQGNWKKSV